ncbi:MAG: bifunctional nuclease family protein [Bacteroidales bacterium]|jgi:bifunctional DNase/RNase|nr:bifunctional nuclease family protein [Bacteroidales bacterium]
MERVKLKVLGISYSQTQSGAYALILIEEDGERRVPIIIGGFEAQAIVIRLENLEPPRPLTHDLFRSFADEFSISVTEVVIYKLEEGVFYSKLICTNGDKEVELDSRTSDAVALSLRFGCPIYISEEILDKAGITMNPTETNQQEEETGNDIEADSGQSEFDKYPEDELYRMIDESVRTEDYERAAAIRDEIEKRKKKGGG